MSYPPPKPTQCRYCNGEVSYENNSELYGRSYGKWPYIYMCLRCKASVGTHPNSDTPLGTLADRTLKDWRMKSKDIFFKRTRELKMSRNRAYTYLQELMNQSPNEAHFGIYEVEDCAKIVRIIQGNNQC